MKTKKLLGIFFLFLCTITLVSCGDDEKQEIYSLSFEKGYYERPLLGAKNIPVRGGNRDYTVTVQNTDVLSIDIDLSSPIDMGNLVVKPKQKGETTITVKDNVTNETVGLKIKIVDSYLNLKVAHPAQVPYTGGENLFFINNSDRDFYLFDEKMEKKECTGNYQFLIKNSTCYMILNFDKELNDKRTYEYNISNTSERMFTLIEILLGIDWNMKADLINRSTRSASPVTMNAVDTETNIIQYFVAGSNDIPENILD